MLTTLAHAATLALGLMTERLLRITLNDFDPERIDDR